MLLLTKRSNGFRIVPTENRIIFDARSVTNHGDLRAAATHLGRELCGVFPQLQDKRITHGWTDYVGVPSDFLPHAGESEGVFHAISCCSYGVSLAPWAQGCVAYVR
tara:strand:- start:509 stop:826 length:318 start_codon:yes stop_codon:yes gene_type:complete